MWMLIFAVSLALRGVASKAGGVAVMLGHEPINSERSADVRIGVHSGLTSDIALWSEKCHKRTLGVVLRRPDYRAIGRGNQFIDQ